MPCEKCWILKASTIAGVIYETVLQEGQKQQQKGLDLTFHRLAHQSQALPEITMFSSWFSGNLMRQPFAFTNMQVDTSRFCSSCLKVSENPDSFSFNFCVSLIKEWCSWLRNIWCYKNIFMRWRPHCQMLGISCEMLKALNSYWNQFSTFQPSMKLNDIGIIQHLVGGSAGLGLMCWNESDNLITTQAV